MTGMETYTDLVGRGLTPAEIERLVGAGDLIRLRRNGYARRGHVLTPERRHRELLEATRRTLAPGAVFTHGTAAVLHDLPMPIPALTKIHITRVGTGGRVTSNVCRHSAPLPSNAIIEIDGFPVTTIERTVIDVARSLPFEDGVAIVDAVLRRGVNRGLLEQELEAAKRRRFNARARRAVAFGDRRAESPGESRSRVLMAQLGLPMPNLQREFCDSSGKVEARVDFDWAEFGVCGEFDGAVKYGRLLQPGQSVEKVLKFEKQREELLRTHSRWTVRWTHGNLQDHGYFRRVLESGFRNGPTGRWPSQPRSL